VRDDAVIATGRSDYANQVNNVLCFPFIFRARSMWGQRPSQGRWKSPPCTPLQKLARQEQSDIVAAAYGGMEDLAFGPDYLIPKPFDPRLIVKIAPAVAKAAMESGVATRPIRDLEGLRTTPAAICLPQRHADAADFRRGSQGGAAAQPQSCTPKARMSGCCGPCKS